MLGASSTKTGRSVNLAAIGNRAVDPLIEGGNELLAFTDALIQRDNHLDAARDALAERLGEPAAAKAAACAGNFEMMNRILDATGVPTPDRVRAIRPELGMDN